MNLLTTGINKKTEMSGSNKTEQFLHENITWKRLLDFFMQENSFLKTRLSEVVDKENDKLFIANAEHFQNEFILKDEYIHDLERDIKEQEKNLQLALTQQKVPDLKTCRKQEKLRNEISYLEKEFAALKNQFNKYLLSLV
jgi:hypothetical protein